MISTQRLSAFALGALGVVTLALHADANIVVEEDFALFTAGTESAPDMTVITENWTVPDSYTHQPGWPGGGVFQAGGCCFLGEFVNGDGDQDYGFISTPVMELYGDITISFRARKQKDDSSYLWLAFCNDNQGPVKYFYPQLTTEWKEFSFTLTSEEFNDPCNVQFTAEDGGIFIDDIRVDRVKTILPAPEALPATNLSLTSFEANWKKSSAPLHYLSIYYLDEAADLKEGELAEDFLDKPSDATGELSDAADTYNSAPYSFALKQEKDFVEVGPTDYPIESFSIWVKPSKKIDYSDSMISVSVLKGEKWDVIAQYNSAYIGEEYLRSFDKDAIGEGATKLRVEYKYSDDDDMVFYIDDIKIHFQEEPQRVYLVDGLQVDGEKYAYSGIDPEKNHFYFLTASDGNISSAASNSVWVDGVAGIKVKALPATGIGSRSFTANWEELPHASGYSVALQRDIEAETDMPGTVILHEDFSKITTGTFSDPGRTYEPTINLGENDMANTGWTLTNPCWVAGMAGSFGTTWYGTAGLVVSPRISLNNNGGNFSVEATVYTTYGNEKIWVMLINDINDTEAIAGLTIDATERGASTGTVSFEGVGKEDVLVAFMSESGYAFFIDEVKIIQDIKAGDRLSVPYATMAATGDSLEIKNLAEATGYTYTVTANREKSYVSYKSDASDPVTVKLDTSGVADISSDASKIKIGSANGVVTVEAANAVHVAIYNLSGMSVASGTINGKADFKVPAGIYIVKAGKEISKVVVK